MRASVGIRNPYRIRLQMQDKTRFKSNEMGNIISYIGTESAMKQSTN